MQHPFNTYDRLAAYACMGAYEDHPKTIDNEFAPYSPQRECNAAEGELAASGHSARFRVPLQRNLTNAPGEQTVMVHIVDSIGSRSFNVLRDTGPFAIIAFEGTSTWETWLYNLSAFLPVNPVDGPHRFHEGFVNLAMEYVNWFLARPANETLCTSNIDYILSTLAAYGVRNIIWTGHSAGGALAALVPWYLSYSALAPGENGRTDFNHRIVDFGTPRYLAIPASHTHDGWTLPFHRNRYYHVRDLVPHTPLALGWHHWGNSIPVALGTREPTPVLSQKSVAYFVRNCMHYGWGALTGTLGRRILEAHNMRTYLSCLLARPEEGSSGLL